MNENNFILIIVGVVAIVAIAGILNSSITGKGTSTSKGEIAYCDKTDCEDACGIGNCDWKQTEENICEYRLFTDEKKELGTEKTWHQYWKCK